MSSVCAIHGMRCALSKTPLVGLIIVGIMLYWDCVGADQATNSVPSLPSPPDYSSFRIIPERNIFNSTRSGPGRRAERRRPNRVDAFGLVGIMEYEKGRFAFFDGSSSEYKTVLRPNGTIAGYTVVEIGPDRVKLARGTNNVTELKVGMQMRREDEGEWTLDEGGGMFAASGRSSTSQASDSADRPGSSSSSDLDEVVKRLMQRREMESK
ncbi:MAG: hypothetical protein N3G20_09475 [Verrucomicrobiae bacterium]|nr:hypothetical protein [Verrucomicrobiae bacterium]